MTKAHVYTVCFYGGETFRAQLVRINNSIFSLDPQEQSNPVPLPSTHKPNDKQTES